MRAFKKIMHRLDRVLQENLMRSAHQVVTVGVIAFVGFPLFYWIWSVWLPQPYVGFWLRALGSLLGLGLVLSPHWPEACKPYLAWYWFVTLLYCLPFFFAFSFLMNLASVVSAMLLLFSVFLLVLLVDLWSLSVLLVLGWGLAFGGYYVATSQVYIGAEHMEMGLVVLLVVVAGATLNYRTTKLQQQRLAGMAAAAGMIAHELRTPLLGIKSGAQALAAHAPQLVSAYRLASEQGLLETPMRSRRLDQLEGITARIVHEIGYANTMIDMLLMKAGRDNTLRYCVLEPCSMAECLEEALERYPFQSAKERSLVSWQGDFQFMGSKLLMQHILFNLLKNALYAIATAERGTIVISMARRGRYHCLYVKDTAKGMSAKQLARLFDHFYTATFMGTGIGLSFCKLVMKRFGGNIACESKEGVYTQFILSFPILRPTK